MVRQGLEWFRQWRQISADLPAKLTLVQVPGRFERRAGEFTANACGFFGRKTTHARYRINDGEWRAITPEPPRVPPGLFTIDMPAASLVPGVNLLEIEAEQRGAPVHLIEKHFTYDASPPELPRHVDWAEVELDVGDGVWETIQRGDRTMVRPRPGFEDYDRTLVVSGAFAGGRRVETVLVFREPMVKGKMFGFGLLPLWGGRPDDAAAPIRRGWNFGLVWYYSHFSGVGLEFSYCHGGRDPRWTAAYRNFEPEPGAVYRVVAEVWPEVDLDGKHRRYRQRMSWSIVGSPTEIWMELTDDSGAALEPAEYGVALIAHRSQVEFGPVSITSLPPRTVSG
jgi:hypothetical protein